MSVRFAEVRKSSGLDLDVKPFPAMIVPLGSSNIIKVLGAEGSSLFNDSKILQIKKLDSNVVIMDKLVSFGLTGGAAGLSADALAIQLKMGVEISLQLAGNPQFFQITGKALGGQSGTTMRVAKTSKAKADAFLRAVVLKPRPLKLSIRPVQVPKGKAGLLFHCERNTDTKILLDRVNAVWTPQANIVFTLASSDPAPLDDQAAINKALGSSSPKPIVPPIIEFDDFSEMFLKLRKAEKPGSDFTIFMVHRITHGGDGHPVYGVTHQKGGFALVSDDGRDEDMKTMAHEIGHFFGTLGKGSLYADDNSDENLLMCQGEGAGTKLPFADVIKFFNKSFN